MRLLGITISINFSLRDTGYGTRNDVRYLRLRAATPTVRAPDLLKGYAGHSVGTCGVAKPQTHHGSVLRTGLPLRSTASHSAVISCGR